MTAVLAIEQGHSAGNIIRSPVRRILTEGFFDTSSPSSVDVGSTSVFGMEDWIPWVSPTIERINELLELPDNWDRQGASSIHRESVIFALTLLFQNLKPNSPPPQIVPLAYGGVQFEWHENGVDLELEVAAPNEVYVTFEDHIRDIGFDAEMTTDFSMLNEPLLSLTRR